MGVRNKRNFKCYSQTTKKKEFTIDDIKEDFDMSMFVTRLIYTSISFDWLCINKDSIQKGKINKYIEQLKVLGLVHTQNFVEVEDTLVEIMHYTYPNYYKNIDAKTCICYRRTETLKKLGKEYLMAQISNKWLDNETFICHLIKMQQENKTQSQLASKIKKSELENYERGVLYPDGTFVMKKTTKFWNLQLENKKYLKLSHELTQEELKQKEERQVEIKNIKKMSREERELRYLARRCIEE